MKKLYAILFLVALIHTGVYGQAKKLWGTERNVY